jgi:hypothetical protein
MRSFFKLPGTVLFAVAALFAVVATSSTANAFTFRAAALPAAAQNGPESVQTVASINWWTAHRARHNVVHALRDDCRNGGTRSQRRECLHETRNALHEMQEAARDIYHDCRTAGNSRRECQRDVWEYWVGQANGGSNPTSGSTDTGGTDTGGTDTGSTDNGGTDTGGTGGVTDDPPV